jgi:hypothetical protein
LHIELVGAKVINHVGILRSETPAARHFDPLYLASGTLSSRFFHLPFLSEGRS